MMNLFRYSIHFKSLSRSIGLLTKYSLNRMSTGTSHRELYKICEPFDSGHLQVSDIHRIYYEQSGKKDGKPILFVHGGPGGGTAPEIRGHFNPDVYRIIMLDQRGAGKSTPAAELKENTTWHLVADLEKLREHVGVDKWVVFGGSWGSTLSLVYAQSHPDRVKALVLRGIFLITRKDLEFYYQKGTSMLFPDHYEKYLEPIPVVERHDLMSAYYRYLTGDDKEKQLACARAWSGWEMATSRLHIDPAFLQKTDNAEWALQFARIECHYFVNGGFFESDSHILDNVDKIRHIPTTIIQGRYDVVCPMDAAWSLHKKWPEAEFHIIPDAGHSAKEDGTRTKLLDATDKYSSL